MVQMPALQLCQKMQKALDSKNVVFECLRSGAFM